MCALGKEDMKSDIKYDKYMLYLNGFQTTYDLACPMGKHSICTYVMSGLRISQRGRAIGGVSQAPKT